MNKQKLTDALTALETSTQLHKDAIGYSQRAIESNQLAVKLLTEATIPETTNYEVQLKTAKHVLKTDDGIRLFTTDDSYRKYIVDLAKEEIANTDNKTIHVPFTHKKEDIVKVSHNGFERITHATLDEEYHVNKEKRTVVCLLRGHKTRYVYAKGIAKCDPKDTFNEHIGKVIALFRAIGEEVPELFTNVPNPEKIEAGDIMNFKGRNSRYEVLERHGDMTATVIGLKKNKKYKHHFFGSVIETLYEVIDDSNRK